VTYAKPKVTLTWSYSSTAETGFKVERSSDGTTFSQIATVGATVRSYVDSGVNRTEYYRVRAYNSASNSAYSNTVRVP
jgi:hypothetical protein